MRPESEFSMGRAKRKMLYLCADRGIPFGRTKGASIHVREFLDAIGEFGYDRRALMVRLEGTGDSCPDYEVATLDEPSTTFFNAAFSLGADKRVIREARDFQRNDIVENRLEKMYDEDKFDLIYERYSLFGTAGCSFANRYDLPFVLEVNAPLVFEAAKYRKLAMWELAKSIELFLFSTADHIIAVSEPIEEYILTVAPSAKVSVVPNGVNTQAFSGNGETCGWRTKLTRDANEDFVIGFVGSVKPWHGVELLVEAMAKLQQTSSAFSLCIVGSGDQLLDELKERSEKLGIADRVTFTGPVAHDDIPAILNSVDALVAPYPDLPDFYFSPLKLFEYMASAKPIVASRIGQVADVLQDRVNGLLVEPGSASDIASALTELWKDRSFGERLGQAARDEVVAKHTWRHRIKQIDLMISGLEKCRDGRSESSFADKVSTD